MTVTKGLALTGFRVLEDNDFYLKVSAYASLCGLVTYRFDRQRRRMTKESHSPRNGEIQIYLCAVRLLLMFSNALC
jgi:hypothetical protein